MKASLIRLALAISLCGPLLPALATPLNPQTPEGAIAATRKIQCSLRDLQPTYFTWEGEAYSRRQGEADKRLFRVAGMNVRHCISVDGGRKGQGYRLLSREVMLYLDPQTGAPLSRWLNPWLQREVEVQHVANDPVNQPPQFPFQEDGSPAARWLAREQAGQWFQTLTIPLFYQNPLQGQYQRYVGGAYHATEMFNFTGSVASLLDPNSASSADVKVGWVRLSDWLPWMEMQGREGTIYIHAAGQKVAGLTDLPPVLQQYLRDQAPAFQLPPPADDARPNETSWTVFQKKIRGEVLRRGGH
ncbi:MAG: hypothetical protein RIR00_598 [Pseudomonadota bacterium]|jgi:hypothetical protein